MKTFYQWCEAIKYPAFKSLDAKLITRDTIIQTTDPDKKTVEDYLQGKLSSPKDIERGLKNIQRRRDALTTGDIHKALPSSQQLRSQDTQQAIKGKGFNYKGRYGESVQQLEKLCATRIFHQLQRY